MRDEIISRIRDHAEAIRALGAGSLYLYGSHARNEANPNSGVDVFIGRNPTKRFTFIELTELEFLLKEISGAEIDLSTRTALHPSLSRDIENTAIKVL
jgi:predicted nucleotidyltransferase